MPAKKREKQIGQVFTPDFIVSRMLDNVGYTVKTDILNKHIIDNSCGNGAFLAQVVERYLKTSLACNHDRQTIVNGLETYIHGIDCDDIAVSQCILRLNDIAKKYDVNNVVWDINYGDTLEIRKYDAMMDYVVGNPPYVRVHNLNDSYDAVKSFQFAEGGMTDLYLVFFEIGFNMLADNGRMCYITPSSWINSVAGMPLRKSIIANRNLQLLIDLGHYQPFEGITTYTMISLFEKGTETDLFKYYTLDAEGEKFVDYIDYSDCIIDGNIYLAEKDTLQNLNEIKTLKTDKYVRVKNGFATLADKSFIGNNIPDTFITIPIIKSSTAKWTKCLFPYDKQGRPLSYDTLFSDDIIREHFNKEKESLLKGKPEFDGWYLYGRTQALGDVWKKKLSLNSLVRNPDDVKIEEIPEGCGMYGGLYIIGQIDISTARDLLMTEDFISYVKSLKKYKSGGYYTFNSRDVEQYLNYKLYKINNHGQQEISKSNLKLF